MLATLMTLNYIHITQYADTNLQRENPLSLHFLYYVAANSRGRTQSEHDHDHNTIQFSQRRL